MNTQKISKMNDGTMQDGMMTDRAMQQTAGAPHTALLRAVQRLMGGPRRSFLTSLVFGLLAIAVFTAPVSAAMIRVNLSPSEVHETVEDLVPALKSPLNDVFGNSLATLADTGKISPADIAVYYQIFVKGEAPADQPEIAYHLSLAPAERVSHALDMLVEQGEMSQDEAAFFRSLRGADNQDVRGLVENALKNESFGPLASGLLQLTLDLTAIDPSAGMETCKADAAAVSSYQVAGFWQWLGGLVKSVVNGAVDGAWIGFLLGGKEGAIVGGIIGGIRGGIKYVSDTTGGNGFMPGPNGEDCTGWPRGFPAGF